MERQAYIINDNRWRHRKGFAYIGFHREYIYSNESTFSWSGIQKRCLSSVEDAEKLFMMKAVCLITVLYEQSAANSSRKRRIRREIWIDVFWETAPQVFKDTGESKFWWNTFALTLNDYWPSGLRISIIQVYLVLYGLGLLVLVKILPKSNIVLINLCCWHWRKF